MRRFPFAAILLLIGAGVCFMMWIMFNYAFDNPDSGLFNLLNESAEATMNTARHSWFMDILDHVRTGFGMSGVILMGLGILVAVARSFDRGGGVE